MITFYFVRHGETEMNANGVLQGFVDSKLTEKGVQESLKLGEYLAENVVFDHVFCSPLGRCKTTCDLILSAYDQEFDVVYDERIMEFNFGPFDGQVYSKAKMKHPEIIKNLFDNPSKYIPQGNGETYYNFVGRINDFLLEKERTLSGNGNQNVLVVCHGGVISAFHYLIENGSLDDIWMSVPSSSVTIFKASFDVEQYEMLKQFHKIEV